MKRRLQMLRVLVAVYRQWRRFPSHRLGQLLVNEADASGPALFYIEDDMLVTILGDDELAEAPDA